MNRVLVIIVLISEANDSIKIKTQTMEKTCKNIILTGGGYASIWAYRAMVKDLLIDLIAGLVKIFVICPEEHHYFHGWTVESFTGIIRDENRMSPLADIFRFAEIVNGKVVALNANNQTIDVQMNDGSMKSMVYDQIMLGTGSSDSSSIDGLNEFGYQLKSDREYLRAKNRVQFLVNQAAEAGPYEASGMLRFVVAGGGYTGVEFAANLAEMMELFIKKNPQLRNVKPSIYLVNSKSELLSGLDQGLKGMKQYAEKTLLKYGVTIINDSKIARITSKGAFLSDGSFIESRMVISTIGQSRQLLNGTEQMEKDQEGRVLTNRFLQIKNNPQIWAAGDAAHVAHPKTGNSCPSNALWAIKQGEQAGKNIARVCLDEKPKAFAFKGLGQCASLGLGKGLGELFGLQFTGWMAWIVRWIFFQHFMPSRKVMWREIGDWMFLLFTQKRKHLEMKNASGQKPAVFGTLQLSYAKHSSNHK
jgi:NADH dehydrogenase